MPILGQDDMRETLGEGVGQRHDGIAWQEVVLHVDDEEDIGESREHLRILAQPRPRELDIGNPARSAEVARFSGQIDAVAHAAFRLI